MPVKPHTAMVLAAGMGMRMRPLTLEKPKPLLVVGGATMLDQALDRLQDVGVKTVVVNTHYLGEQIARHVKVRNHPKIILSPESELLDTGGGVKHALPLLGHDPIFVVNADLPWRDGAVPALQRLAAHFDAKQMDALLLLMPLEKARGFQGAQGDFFMEDVVDGMGRLRRLNRAPPRPYVFISAQLVKPELYSGVEENIFSNNAIWNKVEPMGRLYGLLHDGSCFHVGTPEDLAEANQRLEDGSGW